MLGVPDGADLDRDEANLPQKKVNSGSRSSGLRKVELPQLELQNTDRTVPDLSIPSQKSGIADI